MRAHVLKKPLLILLLLLGVWLLASCSDGSESGELAFAQTSDKQAYHVTGIGTHEGSTVTIPETYNGLPVTYIDSNAFKDNDDIEKVVISKNVTQIYSGAFDGCSNLETVICHSTSLNLVAENAFRGTEFLNNKKNYEDGVLYIGNCALKGYPSYNGAVRLRDGTSVAAYRAFKDCALTEITFPTGFYHMGKYTFYGATSLERITFEGSLGYLSDGAFYGCTSLKSVHMPDGCINIYARVFFGCTSLEEVTFGTNTTTIGRAAFSGCSSLKSLNFPAALTTVGDEAFKGCTALTAVTGATGLRSIGAKAFSGCTSLSSISLPSNTEIGVFAFKGTAVDAEENELSLTLSANGASYFVTGIGTSTATEIVIPSSYRGIPVTHVAEEAFKDNTAITKVTLPASLTQIHASAFEGCTALETVVCNSQKLELIMEDSFKGTPFEANTENYEDGALYLGNCLLRVDPDHSAPLTVKEGVSVIAYSAARGASLTALSLPSTLLYTGKYAFADCTALATVTFGGALGYLGDGFFMGCTALTAVTLPDKCINLNAEAFKGCTALKEVTLPETLVTVRAAAFEGCVSLQTVTIPDSVTEIGENAFAHCSSLTALTGMAGVKLVKDSAFMDCRALTECPLPDSAECGENVFLGTPLGN